MNDVGEAVLSDIGVSRVALDDTNPAAVTAGLIEANAARWMAPELLDSHFESPRLTKETDIYAFSMLAIEVRHFSSYLVVIYVLIFFLALYWRTSAQQSERLEDPHRDPSRNTSRSAPCYNCPVDPDK